MTDTTHLALPFIDGSQAQKHVTHNEALRILDAAIQIGVENTTLTMPPESPAAGARYLVPGGASGAWSGQAHAVACWEDGAWRFLIPKMGWCVWSAADEMQLVFNGAKWRNMPGGGETPGAITKLGVNATPDDDNRLSVCSNAALFRAIDAADGGSGDMRIQISKEATDNVASVVFSDAFSGRAEFGLISSDAFKLKVSDDGTSFTEAFIIDQATGNLTLPRGLALSGVISPAVITADQNNYDPAGLATCAVLQLAADAPRAISGLAGGAEGRMLIVLNVGSNPITLRDDSASSLVANRFAFGGDIVLGPKHAAVLRYDGTAARWFAIARSDGVDGGGSGNSGAGLSDADRRNIALDRIYQSKLFGAPRRVINAWATGFKAASDTDRGIDTAASSNVDASKAAASGYVVAENSSTITILLHMDGSNGSTAFTDSSPNAFATTATNAVISTSQSKFGGASGSFNGSSAYVTLSHNALLSIGSGDMTVDAWIRLSSIGASQEIANKSNAVGSTYANWDFAVLANGKLQFQVGISNSSGSVSVVSGATALAANTWYHVAGQKSGNTITVWVNGVQDGSTSVGTTPSDPGAGVLRIGATSGTISNHFNGFIDELRISMGTARYAATFIPRASAYDANGNMTLVTVSQTTGGNVSNARALIEFDNSAAPTLNTDLTAEVTCDGGSNWAAATLSAVTSYSQGGRKVVETADTACTAGTSFAARIKTVNGKTVPIYGVSVTAH